MQLDTALHDNEWGEYFPDTDVCQNFYQGHRSSGDTKNWAMSHLLPVQVVGCEIACALLSHCVVCVARRLEYSSVALRALACCADLSYIASKV